MSDLNPERRVVYAVTPGERSSEQEELLSVGTRCTAKGCSQFDFLPFKCSHCNEQYCQEHFLPEVHSCSKWDKNAADRRALECPFCQALIAIPPGEDPNIRIGRHIDDDCLVLGQNKSSGGKKKTPICRRPKCGKRLWQPIECDVRNTFSLPSVIYVSNNYLVMNYRNVTNNSVRHTVILLSITVNQKPQLILKTYLIA